MTFKSLSVLAATAMVVACLGAGTSAAHAGADKPTQAVIPLCDGSGSLVITANSEAVTESITSLLQVARSDKPQREQLVQLLHNDVCAQHGPHAGAWLLAGTLNSMDVGVIPYGQGGSGLLIAKPRYTVIPLLDVHVEPLQ